MKNKKIITKLLITLGFGLLVVTNFIPGNFANAIPPQLYEGESFTWNIEGISENATGWYDIPSWAFVTNWQANVSTEISFEVDGFTSIDEETFLTGNLTLGNASLIVDNKDISFNLALSANPWDGGLVSVEDDWTSLSSLAPFNGPNAQIDYEKRFFALDQDVDAIEITYDDGFQKSSLVYEPITGVLLYANSTSGAFWLEIKISDSSIPLPLVSTNLPMTGLSCVIGGLAVVIVLRRRKTT